MTNWIRSWWNKSKKDTDSSGRRIYNRVYEQKFVDIPKGPFTIKGACESERHCLGCYSPYELIDLFDENIENNLKNEMFTSIQKRSYPKEEESVRNALYDEMIKSMGKERSEKIPELNIK